MHLEVFLPSVCTHKKSFPSFFVIKIAAPRVPLIITRTLLKRLKYTDHRHIISYGGGVGGGVPFFERGGCEYMRRQTFKARS